MGRLRKSKVIKSPYKLRQRKLSDGRISLFIDFIENGKHKYEFLKLYLLPETSEKIRRENTRTIRKADDIIKDKTEDFIRIKSEEQETKDSSQILLIDFIQILIDEYKRLGKGVKQLNTSAFLLKKFNAKAKMSDVDKKFCIEYTDWLKNEYTTRNGERLKPRTVFNYFWQFSIIINRAVKMGYLNSNPWSRLDPRDKLKMPESRQMFLSIEQLKILEKSPFKKEMIKKAFIFSCYSGLRISDILKLKWSDIYSNNGQTFLSITMKKTKKPIVIPLNQRAISWLPEKKESSDLIFEGLPHVNQINKYLKRWGKQTSVSDNLHFHVARHSYGTMLMTAGVDLYTASKLMGHSDIRATQVYAEIIDQKKKEAMTLVDNLF